MPHPTPPQFPVLGLSLMKSTEMSKPARPPGYEVTLHVTDLKAVLWLLSRVGILFL